MNIRNVHLFVFDSMADWEAAFAIAGINNPQFQRTPGQFRVVTVGSTTKPITTVGGVRILPDIGLSEIDPNQSAILILPGGDQWERYGNIEAIQVARTLFVEAVPIAAICGATLALARAGMLDDFHHTGNSREYLAASGYRGGSFYCDAPAVTDEGVITASGIAPIEFAREIFRTLGLYSREALDAWYALYRFGDVSRYSDLLECVSQ
ncbi:MAG: type 1 glutamine amidotransferase family protein [Terracidiphilus sp.]